MKDIEKIKKLEEALATVDKMLEKVSTPENLSEADLEKMLKEVVDLRKKLERCEK